MCISIPEGMTSLLALSQDNEVAAVQPPPVVHYSQDHTANNGAEQISPPHPPIEFPRREPENRNPNPPDSRYPDPRYPPNTDNRYTDPVQPHRYPVQPERNPITPARRPSPPVNQPEGHVHTSGPGVSSVNFITTFAQVPCVYFLFDAILIFCTVASYCPEFSTSGQHERHSWGRLPVLPAGSGRGPEGNVQGLLVFQTSGSLQYRSQIWQRDITDC